MKKIIGFGFLLVTIFFIGNYILRAESKNNNWYQFKQIPQNSIDIFYAGNSRSYSTMIPQVIESFTDLQGYVLGIGTETLAITYYELEEMFKTQSPSFVVLEVYPIYLSQSGRTFSTHVFSFYDSIPVQSTNLLGILEIYNLKRAPQYFPFIRQHAKIWKEPNHLLEIYNEYIQLEIIEKTPWALNHFINTDGYQNSYLQISQHEINRFSESYLIKETDLNDKTKILLERIIKLCKKNEAELIIWSIAKPFNPVAENGINLDYEKIAKEYKISFLDLRKSDYSLIHYGDINHLAPFGTFRASLEMGEFIASTYTLPIDNENLSELKALSIFSYEYGYNENSEFIVTIYLDENIQKFEIKGKILNVGEEKIVGDLNNQNSILFNLGSQKPTQEYIKISLRNLTIDYKIIQDVYINYDFP